MLTITDQTMSSREIAELTGKRHDNVLRDCEVLNENYEKLALLKIEVSTYKDSTGRSLKCYELTRMQTFDLMTGYNTELRIKVNRRWEELEKKNMIDFTDPSTILQLAQNWADEQARRKEAEKQIRMLQPKADLFDKVMDLDSKIDIGQAAKILELPFGRNTLFEKLREKGIFFKNRNEPKQEYIDRGLFALKEKVIGRENHPDFTVIKVLVTQKGLDFLAKEFGVIKSSKELSKIE